MKTEKNNKPSELEILLQVYRGKNNFEDNNKAINSLAEKGYIHINKLIIKLCNSFEPDDGTYRIYDLSITVEGKSTISWIKKEYEQIL